MDIRRGSATVALILLATTLPVASAWADSDQPDSTNPLIISPYKTTVDKFKMEMKQFHDSLHVREISRASINKVFRSAVTKASKEANLALKSATTVEQKNAILTSRRNAILAAVAIRDRAILALGPMPLPPAEPEMSGFKEKKDKNDKNPGMKKNGKNLQGKQSKSNH
ncbi:MAG: hypothetical protein F2814_02010 [Actinobacteria bacterium]|nr:hypothetical protein [Actinomycetota bacterium]